MKDGFIYTLLTCLWMTWTTRMLCSDDDDEDDDDGLFADLFAR